MQNLTEVLNSTLVGNSSEVVTSSSSTTSTTTTTTTEEPLITTIIPPSDHTTATSIAFISIIIFGVACALIAKIVISHKKKRAELIGSARWRISASRQSASSTSSAGTGPTSATYLPMGRGGNNRSLNNQREPLNALDHPTADRLDWERQFFDDSEATTPSRLTFR